MIFKKVAAIVSAAALTLVLTGCGNDPVENLFNNPPNGQTSGTTLSPFESKTTEIEPAESKPTVQLPDIPVNDSSAFEYKYDSELCGMVITDYKLQSPKIHIPDTLENEKVVKVDFSSVNKDITHIIMPDSVQDFDFSDTIKGTVQFVNIPTSVTELKMNKKYKGFLEDCRSLTSITIPDSVTKIGDSAFENCTNLTSVTIGNGVTYIGWEAFRGCENIHVTYKGKTYDYEHISWLFDAIKLGDSGMRIEDRELKDVSGELTEVIIPDGVTVIGQEAFMDCTNLTSVNIPDSVTVIGQRAFKDCTNLTSITIPDRVTKIGDFTFSGCTSLTNIIIPDSVTEIGWEAFGSCTRLTSVTIGNSVTSIGGQAFNGCTNLSSITIGNSVTSIGDFAFHDCTSLTSVIIPDSTTAIGRYAFHSCTNLTNATYKGKIYDYEHMEDLCAAINGN